MRSGIVIIVLRLYYKNRKIKHFLPLAGIFEKNEGTVIVQDNKEIGSCNSMTEEKIENGEKLIKEDDLNAFMDTIDKKECNNLTNDIDENNYENIIIENQNENSNQQISQNNEEQQTNHQSSGFTINNNNSQNYVDTKDNPEQCQNIINSNYDELSTKLNKDTHKPITNKIENQPTSNDQLLIKRNQIESQED